MGSRINVSPIVYVIGLRYIPLFRCYVALSLRTHQTICRERDSTTGYQNGLLGNQQETGRAVRVAVRGARGDLRAKRDTVVLAGGSSRPHASYGWIHAQLALLRQRGLALPFVSRRYRICNFRKRFPLDVRTTSESVKPNPKHVQVT